MSDKSAKQLLLSMFRDPHSDEELSDAFDKAVAQTVKRVLLDMFNDHFDKELKDAFNEAVVQAVDNKEKPTLGAPKLWKTAFGLFCQETRELTQKNNPCHSPLEITRLLEKMWKDILSEKEKDKYFSMELEDKKRYNDELHKYANSYRR